jgi:glycine betaine catabolism A
MSTSSAENVTTRHTLTGADYLSADVYALEQRVIFHHGWFFAGRGDSIGRGGRHVVNVAGQSVLVVRDLDGSLYAHANVCRHRGSLLCEVDQAEGPGSIMCPYHAFTYALDGRLIATPRVDNDELDKSELSLWRLRLTEWQGFVFVSLNQNPIPLHDWLTEHAAHLLSFEGLDMGNLRTAVRTQQTVAANWKILCENYQECLHCALVHPELVELIPTYRSGDVIDRNRDDGGVHLLAGANSFSANGRSSLPLLPGISPDQADIYQGAIAFPNMFIDVTGTSVIVSGLYPNGAGETTVVMEYLVAADTLLKPDFDMSEIVEFSELVGKQDYVVCERVQQGVGSQSFDHGVFTKKDQYVLDFVNHYRAAIAAKS